jgi:transketolase
MTDATTAVLPGATRQAYRDRLLELMPQHRDLVCLDTDTGLFADADFGTAAGRYVNLGIAEHNLMGVAAGLAASARMPFVNTMAAFAASRAAEVVKIDIAYNDLPVRIAATHSGLAAAQLGPTHQALEDLAVMRALPNMTVVVPADSAAVRSFVDQSLRLPGPLYLRLGRKATPALPVTDPPVIGRVQRLLPGSDVVLVACGPYPVHAALAAAGELATAGVDAGVLNMHTVKPLDVDGLCAATAAARLVVTVEEHWRSGGLGAAVAEALAEHAPVRVIRLGMPDTFASHVGSHESLLEHYGITAAAVADTVRDRLPARTGGHRSPVPSPARLPRQAGPAHREEAIR